MSSDKKDIPLGARTSEDVELPGDQIPDLVKEEDEFPTDWKKIAVIMTALYMTMFLVALDRTIIGTAIPQIVHDFHSIDDVGWYASAYLITASGFQLVYGRIYTFYSPKNILLIAILNFEIGVRRFSPSSSYLY
jgi:MFS family permease